MLTRTKNKGGETSNGVKNDLKEDTSFSNTCVLFNCSAGSRGAKSLSLNGHFWQLFTEFYRPKRKLSGPLRCLKEDKQ